MVFYKPVFAYLLFVAILAVPPLLLMSSGSSDLLVVHFWLIFFFISVLTLLAVILVLIMQQINTEMYVPAFLGATTFKILVCLVFVLLFIRKNHPDRVIFVADFMYIYFLNTAFEVYALLRNLRNQNLK